jgi:2-dehydropantoate 2-reductase
MRVLVLGAGATGGYFGGRLIEAGVAKEVAFLVRPGRKAQLERDGLVIESPAGDFRRHPVSVLLPGEAGPGWDVILLACKAYDLDDAIAALRSAVGEGTAVLPLLNGIEHLDRLEAAFGRGHVLGGLTKVVILLTKDGVVRQIAPPQFLEFGELDGRLSARVLAIHAAFAGTAVQAEAVPDVLRRMWEKLVIFGTFATATVLMRANLGEVVAGPGGGAWLEKLLRRNAEIAAAHGHPVRDEVLEGQFLPFLRSTPQGTSSMSRDVEAGRQIEADHVLRFLLEAARRAGVPDELHEAAYIHAKAYEARRDAGRLASA